MCVGVCAQYMGGAFKFAHVVFGLSMLHTFITPASYIYLELICLCLRARVHTIPARVDILAGMRIYVYTYTYIRICLCV